MNERHQRAIAIAFRLVDERLQRAVQSLAGNDGDSPFNDLVQDAVPVQHRVISDYARRVRSRMAATLDRLGIPIPPAFVPATRAAFTSVLAAQIDIEEVDPHRLRGYGEVPAEDARALVEAYAEILALLGQMRDYLAVGPGANLETRLTRLTVRADLHRLLQELLRVITAHGLVTLRPSIERLIEAAEHRTFEIAVFGRVSSGKSSLLNHVLGAPVLPVGVTPVTALVAHIRHGTESCATIEFATERAKAIAIEDLHLYATEQENPSNRKHVTRIRIEVPSERLQHDIAFVDTPGLGSLAGSGKAETMAYLPRADLGVVLIDVTAVLTPEDLLTLDALVRAGVDVMVVLSKADLLGPEDRRRVRDYTIEHLREGLGVEIPVHVASVVGDDAVLADQWFDSALRPLLAANHRRKAESLARKAGILKDQVVGLLRSRAEPSRAPRGTLHEQRTGDVDAALRRAEALPERSLSLCLKLVRGLPDGLDELLIRLSSELAAVRNQTEAEALLARLMADHMASLHAQLLTSLEDTRQAMSQALDTAARLDPAADLPALPTPQGLPSFDVIAAAPRVDMHDGPFRWVPSGVRKRQAHSQLRRATPELREAFRLHGRRLEEWCQGYLSGLERLFQGYVGPFRALSEPAASGEVSSDLTDIEHDIHSLEALTGATP